MRFFLNLVNFNRAVGGGLLLILMLNLLLAGCAVKTQQTRTESEPLPVQAVTPKKSEVQLRRERIERLLAAAENALAAGRLTLPLADNACDRYRAVLLLQPDNQQAQSGLDLIAVRYLQMARDSISRSQWADAQTFIDRAGDVNAQNPLLREVINELKLAKAAQMASHAGDHYLLDVDQLNSKSEALVELLNQIATRVRESDESLVIEARTDGEGRWLYKQMKQAASGYRIRGDIKVGAQPKIIILPPL